MTVLGLKIHRLTVCVPVATAADRAYVNLTLGYRADRGVQIANTVRWVPGSRGVRGRG